MFAWLKKLKNFASNRPGNRIDKPIFIIGCGRSGTTILFQIMQKHPQLSPTTGYPDGEDHIGWVEHGKCLISGLGHPHIDGGRTGFHYCLYMDESDVTPEIINSMTSYYREKVLLGDASKRALNKCPHNSNKLRFIRGIFPDAKFIHIIRDCLPTVGGWIAIMQEVLDQVIYWPKTEFPCLWVLPAPKDRTKEEVFKKEPDFYPGDVAMLAEYWAVVNRNIPIQLVDSPEQLLTIKYEDLCAEPLEILRIVCEFCEIAPFSEVPFEIRKDFNETDAVHVPQEKIKEILERAYKTRSLFGYL